MHETGGIIVQRFGARLLERVQCERAPQRPRDLPADDIPGKDVDHERHIAARAYGPHVGQIRQLELVGMLGREVSIHEVERPISTMRCNLEHPTPYDAG